jgi:tol-pal system protein YbgF
MTARLLAGVLALALCACATTADVRSVQAEVDELRTGGGGGGGLPNARLAELGAQISELREEVAQLRGSVEEARHAAEQALMEARAASQAPAPRSGAVASVPAAAAGTPGSMSAEVRSYEEAFRLYRAEDYPAAIDRFQGFLQTYPSSDYADNALFWLGECHLKLGDQEQAVLAFDDVVKRYPEGNKVPDALYRQGIALLEIGDRTGQQATYRPAARQTFQRLVDDYPQSERTPEARRQLEKLAK